MQCLGNMVEESEFPSQAVMIFVWSSKKHVVLHYPNERLCSFYWLILDAFHWVLLSVSLTGSSTSWNWLVFWKELIIEDSCLIPPYTQHHLLWMKPFVWLTVVHFACPMISSIPHYWTVSISHCLSQFILKMEHFHYISVENHMWKYDQEGSFGLT